MFLLIFGRTAGVLTAVKASRFLPGISSAPLVILSWLTLACLVFTLDRNGRSCFLHDLLAKQLLINIKSICYKNFIYQLMHNRVALKEY